MFFDEWNETKNTIEKGEKLRKIEQKNWSCEYVKYNTYVLNMSAYSNIDFMVVCGNEK